MSSRNLRSSSETTGAGCGEAATSRVLSAGNNKAAASIAAEKLTQWPGFHQHNSIRRPVTGSRHADSPTVEAIEISSSAPTGSANKGAHFCFHEASPHSRDRNKRKE